MDIATLGIAVDSRQIKEADRSLGGLTSAAGKAERATEGLSSAAGALKGALAGLSLGLVASKLIDAERATGILNVQLKTATGSAGAASVKFAELTALATRLPSSLQDVTQAFVKLKNLGLDPSERAIISYSNTAAAMGKTLNDMIEAVADASTGEFERLKEFGIRAKTQGDQIQFTFQGVTTSVKNNAQSITEYLTRIGEVNFAGAATERMNTLDGAISNLGDSFDSLLRTINSGGFGTVLADSVRVFTGALQDAEKVLKAMDSAQSGLNQSATVGAAIQRGFGVIFETVSVLGANVAYVLKGIGSEIGGIAAQLAALGRGDVAGAARIGEAIREDAVKARQEVDRLTASILGARNATATPQELNQQFRASERAYANQVTQQKTLTEEVKKTNKEKLKLDGAGLVKQERGEIAQLVTTMEGVRDPLRDWNRELQKRIELEGMSAPQRDAELARMRAQNELMARGVDLGSAQAKAATDLFVARSAELQQAAALSQVRQQTVGQFQQLQTEMAAVNLAAQQFPQYAAGYSAMMRQLVVDTANLKLQLGDGSFQDAITSITGQLAGSFTNVLDGLTTRFGDFYSSIASGAARSIGQAIVYSDSLGDSLTNVAKSAASSLISSFVELGIQYAANAALGQTVSATAAATSATLAAATSAAWATPAALVNAATFGGGAVAGTTALASSVAAAQGLALAGMAGFKEGGYTGNVGTSDVAGVVHGREFVMNAAATAANRPALEAMNRGGSAGTQVTIENYAPGVVVEQVDETRFRVIASEEANKAISNRAPEVIASDMANPNGRTSKAMSQNYNVSRRRA